MPKKKVGIYGREAAGETPTFQEKYTLPSEPSEEVESDWQDVIDRSLLSEEDLLARIRINWMESWTYCSQYRNLLDNDFWLFINQKRGDPSANEAGKLGKIGDSTLFNAHSAMMARDFEEEPVVKFTSNDLGQTDVCRNVNSAWSQDYSDQDLQVVDYFTKWYKNLFGVGIKSRIGWDGSLKKSKFQFVDPRIWLPDPNGNYASGDFQFTGFEQMFNFVDLKDSGYKNLDKLVPTQLTQGSESQQKTKDQSQVSLARKTSNPVENPYYDTYWHFCYVPCKDGKTRKAMFLTGNYRGIIVKMKFLKEVTKEQKADPTLVPWPFSFHYWKPQPNNPFGDRPANYLRDIQKAKSYLANLRISKAKAELFPMYFFNEKYVKSSNLGFGFNKFIPVNMGLDQNVPLSNIVQSFKPDARADWSFEIDKSLDTQGERSTSLGSIVQGATPESRRTLGEQQLIQGNTDVNLSLASKIGNWGEEAFIRMWLQGYLENFEDGDIKIVTTNTGVGSVPVTMKRKDFLLAALLKIQVSSKNLTEAEQKKEYNALLSVYALLTSTGTLTPYQTKLLGRDLLQSAGFPEYKMGTRMGDSPEEAMAKQENDMLSYNVFTDVSPDDDDYLHMLIHKGAGETAATVQHVLTHWKQYASKGKPQPQMQQGTGIGAGVATSNIAQQNAAQPQPAQLSA